MRAWVLVELGDPEAIDIFLREDDAERALAECLTTSRNGWRDTVEPVELDEREVWPN